MSTFNNLLIIHLALCCVYFIIFFRKKKMILVFPIILLIPYIGALSLAVFFIISKFIMKDSPYAQDEVIKQVKKMEYISYIDKEKEKNIIPIQEALIVNDSNIQRQMVMDIVKRNASGYLDELKASLASEDTETAHYAASSILQLKRGLDKELIEAKKDYLNKPNISATRKVYITALNNVISADLNLDSINEDYINSIIELLIIDVNDLSTTSEESYIMLIDYLIRRKEYNEALKYLNICRGNYNQSDKMYQKMLEIAYKTNDDEMFEKTFRLIDKFDFDVSKKTREMADFWKQKKQGNE